MTRTKVPAWRNGDEHTVKRISGNTFAFKKKKIPRSGFRFPTCRAANKYEVYTKKRNLFMERGFTSSESYQHELPNTVTRVIKAHKWETFCQNPSPASIPLVREFYANYDPDEPDFVRVRGKLVDVSASAINSLYSLTDHQSSFFEVGSDVSPFVMRDVVKEFTGKIVTSRKARYIDISLEDLKADQDIWWKFIQYNLLPTHYFSEISKDSATLLYCIMVGKPINVGKVIAEQIKKCDSQKYDGLCFPSLITRLCKKHDVVPSSCEPVQQPQPLLDYELVESESDQQTSLSDHDNSLPAEPSCQSPQATSSQPLPPVVPSAPSAEPSSSPQCDSDEVTSPLLTTPVTPSAPATEPSSPPQTDLDELPIGLKTAKRKKRALINTENQKKKQKTTRGSISTRKSQPLERISPLRFRFPTGDNQKRYEMYTSKRNLLMERGFVCPKSNHLDRLPIVSQPIKSHKWEIFCQDSSHASVPLVREFYANYDATRPDVVYVRGKLVDASASAINSIFSLTNHQNTLFDDVSKISPLAMNGIVEELTRRKVIVGEYYTPFYQDDLKKGPEIWKSFTERNLFPYLGSVNVGKEMAILLYCIMVGKPINVGKVIAKQIQICASLNSGDLWFPILITRLCERHNVLPASHEPIQRSYFPLYIDFVARTTDYESVESEHDQQTNPSNQQTSHSDPDPSFPVANTDLQSPENVPTHFDSYQESPLRTAQATSSQPLPPLAPPAELSCLHQSDSDKLPTHIPGEAAEKSLPPAAQATSSESLPSIWIRRRWTWSLAPPQTESVELQSPLPTTPATSSQTTLSQEVPPLTPPAPSAEPSFPPQTDLDELPIGLDDAKTKARAQINAENQEKKQKTTTQGSISTGNPQPLERIPAFGCRFPTADKQKRYESYTSKRNLFMEKGFICAKSNNVELLPIVSCLIKSHKWENFCQHPSHASIPVVREFYTNYDADRPDVVYVRGKLVDASPSAINSMFSLTNHENTLFDDVSKVSPLAMSDIVYELTGRRKGIVDKYYRPFHQNNLKKGPEIWKSFTERNLFPYLFLSMVRDNVVEKEMAILLYCIMVGKPINVGKVIAEQIRECACLNSGDLWFPTLITRLCERHNVLPASDEPIQQPDSPLHIGFVARTTNYEPVESEPGEQTNPSNQQTSHLDHDPLFPNEFGSGPNLPVSGEDTENVPTHFDSYQQSPPPTAQATSSQPLPPSAPPAELSCLHQTDSDKLPIHIPGLPILAEASGKSPPFMDSCQKSPPPTAQATSSQSQPPVAPSVLPAKPLAPPQTDSVKLQVSSPQCDTICMQGYNVKRSVAPILEAIFKKHGDIAAECLFKTASVRSYFLEVVCEAVTRIESNDVIEKMEEINCQVSDAEAANINVSWLKAHLEAVHKRKEVKKRLDLLMETKVNTSLVTRAAQMDLRESCEELVAAQERFEKAERCARILHLVEKYINKAILESKAEHTLLPKEFCKAT